MKKRNLSILMVLILAISSISASACNTNEYKVSEYGITQMEKDGAYITTVSAETLSAIRMAGKSDSNQRAIAVTEIEQSKEILRSIGYDDGDFVVMGDEEVNYLANNAESMVITDTYYRINEAGNVVLVSLDEYNNAQISLAFSSENDAETSVELGDGWFHITTTAVYVDPSTQNGEKGWYSFSGHYEWLKIPKQRMTDAASLGFDVQLQWSNDLTTFSSTRMTIMGDVDSSKNDITYLERKEYEDIHLFSDGLYCEWNLPSDFTTSDGYPLEKLKAFEIYLRGKARIGFFNEAQGFTMYSRYEHVYSILSLNPGFSWDGSVLGVSVNPAWHSDSNTYSSHCGVYYDPSKSSERG